MGTTMKRISIEEKPKTVLGKGFRILDLQAETVPEVYQCGKCGAPIEVQKPTMIEAANLVDLLKRIILSIGTMQGTPPCSIQDSINAYDFMQQAGETTDGVLKVTDGIHAWLVKVTTTYGPAIFGVNVNAVLKALDNFERTKEKAEKED